MKIKKNVLICALLLTFISCNLNSSDPFEAKNTIKEFSHLKDPEVMVQKIIHTTDFLGIRVSTKITGSVFMVIDFENHEVFDWIFVPKLYGADCAYGCKVQLDSGKTVYCASMSDTGTLVVLDPSKTTLEYIKTGLKDIGYICHTQSPKGVVFMDMEVKGEDPTITFGMGVKFTSYDLNKKSINKNIKVITTRKESFPYKVFSNGDLLFPRYTSKKTDFYRVSNENKVIFSCEGTDEKYGLVYPSLVPCGIIDEKIYVSETQLDYKNDKLLILEKNSQNDYVVSKEILMSSDYPDYNFGTVFKMNEKFYSLIYVPNVIGLKKLFTELDIVNGKVTSVNDFFGDNSIKGDFFVRGTRIYFLNYSDDLIFSYYDFSDQTSNTITVPKL